MAMSGEAPHFVLLPFLAQGQSHFIPMMDIGMLLARRGTTVSILMTPPNLSKVKKVVDRAIASGLSIRTFELKFAGQPEGCENLGKLSTMDDLLSFFKATVMMREPVEELLLDLNPTCLIADSSFLWATDMALKLRIPHLVFHVTCVFSLVCLSSFRNPKILQDVDSDREYFVVPGLPDRIEITKVQMRGFVEEIKPEYLEIGKQLSSSLENATGIVINTFHELEPQYIREYIKLKKGKNVWCVGPVSLCNEDDSYKAERGSVAAIDGHDCLKWLDSHPPNSIIYVCIGSISLMATPQLKEMGLGLEASNRPFVWVIREAPEAFESWMSEEKFEERIGGRGLLIRGWAPQVLILSHSSIGGFITHCGWNSTLEAVTAGVPMITWPLTSDQFWIEKLIVNVIKTGVKVGVEVPMALRMKEGAEVQVRSEDIKVAINKLMDGGEESEGRRERAMKLGEEAKKAVEEGGSSHNNISKLIQDMVALKAKYGDIHEDGATALD